MPIDCRRDSGRPNKDDYPDAENEMTIPIPEKITTPDKVKTPIGTLAFFDGTPIGDTKESVCDYMDRARAVMV